MEGYTVAILLIKNGIEVPEEWKYDPLYKINNDKTTAIRLAEAGIIPPKEWTHNPKL